MSPIHVGLFRTSERTNSTNEHSAGKTVCQYSCVISECVWRISRQAFIFGTAILVRIIPSYFPLYWYPAGNSKVWPKSVSFRGHWPPQFPAIPENIVEGIKNRAGLESSSFREPQNVSICVMVYYDTAYENVIPMNNSSFLLWRTCIGHSIESSLKTEGMQGRNHRLVRRYPNSARLSTSDDIGLKQGPRNFLYLGV